MNRNKQWIVIGALTLVIIAALSWLLARHPGAPPYAVQPPREGAVTGPAPMPPGAHEQARPQAAEKRAAELPTLKADSAPLPPLVPGNPLNDEQFAAISAKIVIAAMGLKQEKDWELNLLAYMEKVLAEAKVSEDQYTEYTRALHQEPDRGRAVAENIIRKVEKKLGYRIEVDKLPMFKLDPEQLKKLERDLMKK